MKQLNFPFKDRNKDHGRQKQSRSLNNSHQRGTYNVGHRFTLIGQPNSGNRCGVIPCVRETNAVLIFIYTDSKCKLLLKKKTACT